MHGPNGTGKSNLFEALEISLCGTSTRAHKFIYDDKDVTTTKKLREYKQRYLHPIQTTGVEPSIEFNDQEIPCLPEEQPIGPDRVELLRANLLTQEVSGKFIDKNATELSSEILGEFSDLAHKVTEYAEQELQKARIGQSRLLADLGTEAPGRVKKTDTACRKVADRKLLDEVIHSRSLIEWLAQPVLMFSPTTEGATKRGAAIESWVNSVETLANKIHSLRSRESIADAIREFLYAAWSDTRATANFVAQINMLANSWPSGLADQVQLWSSWLVNKKSEKAPDTSSDKVAKKEKKRTELEKHLDKITKTGRVYAERESHFEHIAVYLEEQWSKVIPDRCPTCDSDLTARGGVLTAVQQVRSANRAERDKQRKNYADTKEELNSLLKELGQYAKSSCPIAEKSQEQIRQLITPHLSPQIELITVLSDSNQCKDLLNWIGAVLKRPTLPSIVDEDAADDRANAIADEILKAFRSIEISFALPSSWDIVVKSLKTRLAGVLDQHLPATIGGVWRELVLNLTPAPWQMPGDLGFRLENRRGSNHTTLSLKSGDTIRLARYVLNAAESHALGLAWFFTRYLMRGRFNHAVLALDDPAQEMDQTTYRDLCRLLETFLRLHSVFKAPLSLLLFFHQDERALDAARATDALLYRLNWNDGSSVLAESNYLYSPGYRHPTPDILFSSVEEITD